MFLLLGRVGPTDMQAALGHVEISRDDRHDPIGRDIGGSRTFDCLGNGFHRHPATGIAAHRPAMQAVIQNVLNAGRVQNRDLRIDKGIFGLMGQGG